MKVTLNYDNNQEVIWKVNGFHGSEWLLARISWSPSRSSKVILYFDRAKVKRMLNLYNLLRIEKF